MRNIEDWKRRLCKIQDRINSIEENVELFSPPNVELTKSVGMMTNLEKEMEIAIRDIEEGDEVRGFYSMSKSKASDVKLSKFGGKPHENFAKFKAEMFEGFKKGGIFPGRQGVRRSEIDFFQHLNRGSLHKKKEKFGV